MLLISVLGLSGEKMRFALWSGDSEERESFGDSTDIVCLAGGNDDVGHSSRAFEK